MRFPLTTASVLSFLALTTARVIKRDIPTIIQDLTQINTDIGSLSAAVYSYGGGLPAALEIQTQEAAVEHSLDQAAADVNGTAVFTVSESNRVTEALTQLDPVMRSSIAALVLKRSLFITAGVGSTIRTNLHAPRVKTDALSVALQSKAVGADKETIRQGTGDVDDAYDNAIVAYDMQM
ncbi:cell wall mannoprotein 1 family protein [Aspergillus saccharolyticus JOP 1030-1]|uniref:Hydrophobic surface binding protein A n=1 Tax=Aspergillus saccharolyticus JOP 1030-1 TaxID=1450539 RepID=A0A318ZDJ4_9EURO|nr:hypothetical protein BP01DRAFT_398563 [Aspergillus saccharolyticus JOP 1030-1]PYH45581.1 hypothetical protein BP01DRAFT_398563 [Aspergillus saccharolyticus JOP 1030-1]